MVEMIVVIGIIGVLTALGSVAYVHQVGSSKISATVGIVNTNLVQARQMAIAMRQSRRVAIDPGELDGFSGRNFSGYRTRRAQIWIEGKICEEFGFEEKAYCQDPRGNTDNNYSITDPDYLPDGVSVVGVGEVVVGVGNDDPGDGQSTYNRNLYIEFNPRGQLSKIYFQGGESAARPKNRAAMIYIARDNEIFDIANNGTKTYADLVNGNIQFSQWNFDDGVNAQQRYKIGTIEILWLTGKTRTYDFAIFGPWPNDEPNQG